MINIVKDLVENVTSMNRCEFYEEMETTKSKMERLEYGKHGIKDEELLQEAKEQTQQNQGKLNELVNQQKLLKLQDQEIQST